MQRFGRKKPEQGSNQPVGVGALIEATDILMRYKRGKVNLEKRIQECEEWWKMRHWEITERKGEPTGNPMDLRPKSAWLFNVILGKQADAVEAYPEPIVLPREKLDKGEAENLTSILPVVLEHNDFEETYAANAWTKNISGTAVYGVFWDKSKLHGMGDITIKKVSALNLFWEPGVSDIQDSPHFFHVEKVDIETLEQTYPDLKGKLKSHGRISLAEFETEDHVSGDKKAVVVDWYYKKRDQGREVLHYVKFTGEHVLFSTENDPELAQRGWYDDGLYPFIFDKLFPVEGSPCGYGYVDIGKSPQMSIDLINQQLLKSAVINATPRYFRSQGAKINIEQFADITQPIVDVAGSLDDTSLMPIHTPPPSPSSMKMRESMIEEMKYTSANMDVQNGITGGGVTAASAIAALQETAGRSSKAATKASYRAYARLVTMVIERIRQFYDLPRQFRILGPGGVEKFMFYSNENIRAQQMGIPFGAESGIRMPVFDIDVKPQRQTAYTRLSQNELAVELYSMGVFNPAMADQALMLLDMMDFTGKEELRARIEQNMMMYQMTMMAAPPASVQPETSRTENPAESTRMQSAREHANQATQPS